MGPATVTLSLTDPAGQPVAGARVTLEGDMSHPGMSPVLARAVETAPGRYRGRMNFTMPGDWVILVHAVLTDGRKVERQVDVNGVRP